MRTGAIFDMDGVLFDTERLYQKTWREVASEMGVTLPEEFTYAVSGTSKNDLLAVISDYYHTDEPAYVIDQVYGRMKQRQEGPLPLKPGVHEFLQMLTDHGVKLAVASSTFFAQVKKNLERNDLSRYFPVIVGGDEVSRAKPYPDIFLLAAERTGLDAADCYVFEDSFNGIRAAHAAGCSPVMVIDLMQPDQEIRGLADHIFGSLLEAREAFLHEEC